MDGLTFEGAGCDTWSGSTAMGAGALWRGRVTFERDRVGWADAGWAGREPYGTEHIEDVAANGGME